MKKIINIIMMKTKKYVVYYYENIKKLDYYTITRNNRIETYIFRKVR